MQFARESFATSNDVTEARKRISQMFAVGRAEYALGW
jgi:hypothetical protein